MNKPDLMHILTDDGLELRRTGRTFKARCPLHADRSPSFVVYPDRGRWRCYGCGQGGDVIDYIRARRGLSYREAIEALNLQPLRRDPAEARRRRQRLDFKQWCINKSMELARYRRAWFRALGEINTMADLDRLGGLYHEIGLIDYQLDILDLGDVEEKEECRNDDQR